MQKLQKSLSLLIVLILSLSLVACGNKATTTDSSPKDVAEKFFKAFETSDYETMKKYCTKECQDTYFHEGDVDGMVWAKLVKIDEENTLSDSENLYVWVEMEASENSVLYGEKETGFYVVFVKDDNSGWLIDSFPTG